MTCPEIGCPSPGPLGDHFLALGTQMFVTSPWASKDPIAGAGWDLHRSHCRSPWQRAGHDTGMSCSSHPEGTTKWPC